jgi:hypothetical protein
MRAILPLAFVFLVSVSPDVGAHMFAEIHSPKECGERVRVQTKPSSRHKELVSVSVTFKPTVPDLYRDRVKAFGELVVKSGEETLHRVLAKEWRQGNESSYSFVSITAMT